jgi:nitroreductase
MDVFDAMATGRAIRRFTKEPVSDELLERLIWAATRAPSPANSQGWDFVVVTDSAIKAHLGNAIGERMRQFRDAGPVSDDRREMRMRQDAIHMATHLHEVPAIIFVCGAPIYPPQAPQLSFVWSALYPATQNLLIAARALGLGTTLTTFQMVADEEIRATLRIPADVQIAAMIPVGWPAVPFSPVRRKPVSAVMHRDGW